MTKPAGPENRFMTRAIREARRNLVRPDGGPFGACIVKDGIVVAVARNTVLAHDATCHAEVNAIRKASGKLGTFDLSGCEIYSTTEPCPMCFGAIHWARIGTVYFGAGIGDAARAGFHELRISNAQMKTLGRSRIRLVPGVLRAECLELFKAWTALPVLKLY
ncbi:MAG: tRNA-specific adenosine deaminase [Candidatus Aminicenantes bacterium]|nr:tRNA-specific adenosine deaminase [Candidatus Aminicenantes bacterium]